jgi:hypothetical protein
MIKVRAVKSEAMRLGSAFQSKLLAWFKDDNLVST